jgi:hypothetical protein
MGGPPPFNFNCFLYSVATFLVHLQSDSEFHISVSLFYETGQRFTPYPVFDSDYF